MDIRYDGFPKQRLSYKSKLSKTWRKACVDWGADRSNINYSPVRNSVKHKKINYDLLHGKIHMEDLQHFVNPDNIDGNFIAEKIEHYPIMNSKLRVLRGEESKRVFDFKVIVTNPNALSLIEENKKKALQQQVIQLVQSDIESEEEFNQRIDKMRYFFLYEWQDAKEIQGNELLKHYIKELNIPLLFNQGFVDAETVGEEIYRVYLEHGEPKVLKLDPMKVRIFKSGCSNKIEDADIIVIDDYLSPGKIIDLYYDELTPEEIKRIETHSTKNGDDTDTNIDDTLIASAYMESEIFEENNNHMISDIFFGNDNNDTFTPYDTAGNIRVSHVFWKSLRKIKDVKSYDPMTGEEVHTLHTEDYEPNKMLGEEVKEYWINEAWEGTRIGEDIYVQIRPMLIQYNRIYNPSKCHFGIIGSIYNINSNKPYSLVDMMKKYNYLYDAIHDRLNKMISRNWGKMVRLDTSKKPAEFSIDEWLYYAKTMGLYVENSFNEGTIGAATGVLAGGMNNNTSPVIDADFGQNIQQYIALLAAIKEDMGEVVGISRLREGQIFNRETVGGVERATLQSSHITEWLFTIHDDIKKRVLECLLDTARVALRGKNLKFQYILSDGSKKIAEIDGDTILNCDYGLVVDNNEDSQKLSQQLEVLAQAGLQNQMLSFSTIMKLYNSSSLSEKQRMVEADEKQKMELAQLAQQQQQQIAEQQALMIMLQEQMKMEHEIQLNTANNQTKLAIAQLLAQTDVALSLNKDSQEEFLMKLKEDLRLFDEKLAFDKEKLDLSKEQIKNDKELKLKQIEAIKQNKQRNENNK